MSGGISPSDLEMQVAIDNNGTKEEDARKEPPIWLNYTSYLICSIDKLNSNCESYRIEWLTEIRSILLELIDCGAPDFFLLGHMMDKYYKIVEPSIAMCFGSTSRSMRFRSLISHHLLLFYMIYCDIIEADNYCAYVKKMAVLIKLYIQCELSLYRCDEEVKKNISGARRSKKEDKIAERIKTILILFLGYNVDEIMLTLFSCPFYRSCYHPIFKKIFSLFLQESLDGSNSSDSRTYECQILAFKIWAMTARRSKPDKKSIIEMGITYIRPPSQFYKTARNGIFKEFLPIDFMEKKNLITQHLLKSTFCVKKKVKEFFEEYKGKTVMTHPWQKFKKDCCVTVMKRCINIMVKVIQQGTSNRLENGISKAILNVLLRHKQEKHNLDLNHYDKENQPGMVYNGHTSQKDDYGNVAVSQPDRLPFKEVRGRYSTGQMFTEKNVPFELILSANPTMESSENSSVNNANHFLSTIDYMTRITQDILMVVNDWDKIPLPGRLFATFQDQNDAVDELLASALSQVLVENQTKGYEAPKQSSKILICSSERIITIPKREKKSLDGTNNELLYQSDITSNKKPEKMAKNQNLYHKEIIFDLNDSSEINSKEKDYKFPCKPIEIVEMDSADNEKSSNLATVFHNNSSINKCSKELTKHNSLIQVEQVDEILWSTSTPNAVINEFDQLCPQNEYSKDSQNESETDLTCVTQTDDQSPIDYSLNLKNQRSVSPVVHSKPLFGIFDKMQNLNSGSKYLISTKLSNNQTKIRIDPLVDVLQPESSSSELLPDKTSLIFDYPNSGSHTFFSDIHNTNKTDNLSVSFSHQNNLIQPPKKLTDLDGTTNKITGEKYYGKNNKDFKPRTDLALYAARALENNKEFIEASVINLQKSLALSKASPHRKISKHKDNDSGFIDPPSKDLNHNNSPHLGVNSLTPSHHPSINNPFSNYPFLNLPLPISFFPNHASSSHPLSLYLSHNPPSISPSANFPFREKFLAKSPSLRHSHDHLFPLHNLSATSSTPTNPSSPDHLFLNYLFSHSSDSLPFPLHLSAFPGFSFLTNHCQKCQDTLSCLFSRLVFTMRTLESLNLIPFYTNKFCICDNPPKDDPDHPPNIDMICEYLKSMIPLNKIIRLDPSNVQHKDIKNSLPKTLGTDGNVREDRSIKTSLQKILESKAVAEEDQSIIISLPIKKRKLATEEDLSKWEAVSPSPLDNDKSSMSSDLSSKPISFPNVPMMNILMMEHSKTIEKLDNFKVKSSQGKNRRMCDSFQLLPDNDKQEVPDKLLDSSSDDPLKISQDPISMKTVPRLSSDSKQIKANVNHGFPSELNSTTNNLEINLVSNNEIKKKTEYSNRKIYQNPQTSMVPKCSSSSKSKSNKRMDYKSMSTLEDSWQAQINDSAHSRASKIDLFSLDSYLNTSPVQKTTSQMESSSQGQKNYDLYSRIEGTTFQKISSTDIIRAINHTAEELHQNVDYRLNNNLVSLFLHNPPSTKAISTLDADKSNHFNGGSVYPWSLTDAEKLSANNLRQASYVDNPSLQTQPSILMKSGGVYEYRLDNSRQLYSLHNYQHFPPKTSGSMLSFPAGHYSHNIHTKSSEQENTPNLRKRKINDYCNNKSNPTLPLFSVDSNLPQTNLLSDDSKLLFSRSEHIKNRNSRKLPPSNFIKDLSRVNNFMPYGSATQTNFIQPDSLNDSCYKNAYQEVLSENCPSNLNEHPSSVFSEEYRNSIKFNCEEPYQKNSLQYQLNTGLNPTFNQNEQHFSTRPENHVNTVYFNRPLENPLFGTEVNQSSISSPGHVILPSPFSHNNHLFRTPLMPFHPYDPPSNVGRLPEVNPHLQRNYYFDGNLQQVQPNSGVHQQNANPYQHMWRDPGLSGNSEGYTQVYQVPQSLGNNNSLLYRNPNYHQLVNEVPQLNWNREQRFTTSEIENPHLPKNSDGAASSNTRGRGRKRGRGRGRGRGKMHKNDD